MSRRFVLIRDAHDAVNPPGIVAEGVVFDSTRVAINWTTKPYSTQVFDNLPDLMAVQERNGVTRIQWIDTDQGAPVSVRPAGAQKLMAARDQLSVFLAQRNPRGAHPALSEADGGVLVVLDRKRK